MQILCATDFSQPARDAAEVAAALAKRSGLPLRLMHCGPEWVVAGEIPLPVAEPTAARAELEAETARLRQMGVEVCAEYCQGSASWEVLRAAAKQATKLIVLGSTGKGRAERWLVGSVAERVAEDASAPTLVVKQPRRLLEWLHDGGSLLILCGVDFTGASDAALEAVREWHRMNGVDIEAAHVVGGDLPADEERTSMERDVWERLHAALGDLPVKVHVLGAARGAGVAEFARLADDRRAGLVVVGTHQRHGLERLAEPSFSRGTLARSGTNVLCVPASAYPPVRRVPDIKRVLVATDLSVESEAAFDHAVALLHAGGEVHLLHVCRQIDAGVNPLIASEVYFDHSLALQKQKEEAGARLNDYLGRQVLPDGVQVSHEVCVHESIAGGICDVAVKCGADVICLGGKGHSRIGAALLGSTVQSVIAGTTRPVFVVHGGGG